MCAKSQNEPCIGILLPPTSGLTPFPCWKESKHIEVTLVMQTGPFFPVFAPSNDDFGPEDFKTSCVEMVVILSAGSCESPATGLDLVQISDKADLRCPRRLKTDVANRMGTPKRVTSSLFRVLGFGTWAASWVEPTAR